jgi:hypothetical protein
MSKLPSVASRTYFAIVSAAPKIVSSAFGNDDVTRQEIFGDRLRDGRGGQRVAAAAPAPANAGLPDK